MLKVIETFSGIGSQAKALKRLSEKNEQFKYKIMATCEWEVGAIYAYDLIHNGKQDLTKYNNLSKDDLIDTLKNYNISTNGKDPIAITALKRMSITQLKSIIHSIESNNNFVDITQVKASNLPEADLLTYSFPCQDLSISSYWWNNTSGINPESGNRSSLLWQVGRLLDEYDKIGKDKPRFLLMENVTAIQNPLHVDNFNKWQELLRKHGYTVNEPLQLNSKNFGIPQNRIRTYMISVRAESYTNDVTQHIKNSQLCKVNPNPTMKNFLKLDYSNKTYLDEAIESIPQFTESRKKIFSENIILAKGNCLTGEIAKTITTKQDRHPNAGLIEHHIHFPKDNQRAPYRNITPREAFLLMGFDEDDFNIIKEENIQITKSRKFLSHSKLLKLAGNSIVVNVLEDVFREIHQINNIYFNQNNIIPLSSFKIHA